MGGEEGPAFERQRRKMAATTGSGEAGAPGPTGRGGMGLGRGPETRRGPAAGARASAGPLSARPRGGDAGGLSREEEQAVAGSTGGGLRGLWAAR